MKNETHDTPALPALASQPARRGRGRPPVRPSEETRKIIVDAAAAEFVTAGFAAANMARIASQAGVSTRTLYRHSDSKDDLFHMVVEERIAATINGFAKPGNLGSDKEELFDLVGSYARFVLSSEVVATTKILLEEQGRFPELVALFKASSERVSTAFDTRIISFFATHAPERKNAACVALLLRQVVMGAQRQLLLGLSSALSDPQIDALTRQTLDTLAIS